MSTKHVCTVADLVRFGCGLKIECGDCGSAKSLDGYAVGGLVGPGPLAKIKARFRCSRCGAKAARLTVLPLSDGHQERTT